MFLAESRKIMYVTLEEVGQVTQAPKECVIGFNFPYFLIETFLWVLKNCFNEMVLLSTKT